MMLAPRLDGRHAHVLSSRAHPIISILEKPTRIHSATPQNNLAAEVSSTWGRRDVI